MPSTTKQIQSTREKLKKKIKKENNEPSTLLQFPSMVQGVFRK
jgi:hypothetical protein